MEVGRLIIFRRETQPGYRFVCWKEGGNVVSQNTTYAFQATADRTLTAVFVADNTTVTLHPGNHESDTFLTLSTANAPIAPSQADADNGRRCRQGKNVQDAPCHKAVKLVHRLCHIIPQPKPAFRAVQIKEHAAQEQII